MSERNVSNDLSNENNLSFLQDDSDYTLTNECETRINPKNNFDQKFDEDLNFSVLQINNEEIVKLESILNENHSKQIHDLISIFSSCSQISHDIFLLYFNKVVNEYISDCSQKKGEDRKFQIIESLFFFLNSETIRFNSIKSLICIKEISNCQGISQLWKILYETGDELTANFLVELYLLSKEHNKFHKFVEMCVARSNYLKNKKLTDHKELPISKLIMKILMINHSKMKKAEGNENVSKEDDDKKLDYFSIFFDGLKEYVKLIAFPSNLLIRIQQTIFSLYSIHDFIPNNVNNQVKKALWKLSFKQPSSSFSNELFNVLYELINRVGNDFEESNHLFYFLLNEILLNKHKYFHIPSKIYEIMEILVKKNIDLANDIINNLTNYIIPENAGKLEFLIKYLTSSKVKRGLSDHHKSSQINSIIQQIFNIADFRYKILSNTNIDDQNPNNDWFIQLQKLLLYLSAFPTTYIQSDDFIHSWEKMISLREKEEVLLNKIENNPYFNDENIESSIDENYNRNDNTLHSLKDNFYDAAGFAQKILTMISEIAPELTSAFEGEIIRRYKGMNGSDLNLEIVEPFYILTLDVINHNSLSDSFNTFISPEYLDNFLIGGIGQCDVERRNMIKKIPEILIIQEKRFEFDRKSKKTIKYSNKFIFPSEIDLKNIIENSNDHQSQQSTIYNLIGVVIHCGNESNGKYISFVKDQRKGWFTIDEKKIKPLRNETLMNSSFGGYNQVDHWDNSRKQKVTKLISKKKCAYLLIYKRKEEIYSNNLINVSVKNIMNFQNNLHSNILSKNIADIYSDIKYIIFQHLLLSPPFSKFLFNIDLCIENTNSSISYFYEYLMIISRNIRNLDSISELFEQSKSIIIQPRIATFIISKVENFYEMCVLQNDYHTRSHYLSLVETALPYASEESQLSFIDSILTCIAENGNELMNQWMNFDEFFHPLSLLIEKKNEKWESILFEFINKTVIDYSNNHRNVEILTKINLSSIFQTLEKIMTNELKECFCPHVSDYQFLSSFIQSRKHFKAFSSFILPFSNSIYKVCQSSTYQILMNPNDAASFFVIHFNFVKGSQFILANIIGKNVKYISQFLHEVHKRIKPFGNAYSEVLIQNMKDLILSLLSSSSKKNRNLITDFLETNPIGYAKLYSILFNEINCIVSVVDNILNDVRQAIVDMEHFPHLIPTKEYFSILALCVNIGNFKKSVLLKANIYLDVLKKLYNVIPRTHLLNFLCTTILEFSEEFFGNNMHNFVTYLDSFRALDPNCEPEVIQNFLDFVPYSHQFSAKFFSHAIFTNLAKNIFSNHINSEIFKEFILRHSNPDNWQLIIKIIWEKNIFEQNLNEKHSAYLQLTSEIIKRFPQSATIFLSRGMFSETLKDLSNKKGSNYFKNITSSADVAEILAVFTDSFFIESNSQKNSSYFGHRFRRNTYSHANNKKNEILGDDSRKFGSIVDNYNKYLNLLNIFAVVSYDKSGSFCRLLQSICVMSNDIKLQLFQLLATEEKSFIKRVPKNASKSAVSLVSCLCFLNINDPKVNDILVREMKEIESIEHFESLAKVAAVVRHNITKFTKVCTDFINQTQEVRAFQGPIRRLLFNVADNLCDTSFKCNINESKRDIEIWDEKATNMLEEIISLKSTSKQNNDVAVLLSFMFECRRKHGVTPRKLSLNEQKLQCLEEIRLDIDISGTDAYDYIYAKA